MTNSIGEGQRQEEIDLVFYFFSLTLSARRPLATSCHSIPVAAAAPRICTSIPQAVSLPGQGASRPPVPPAVPSTRRRDEQANARNQTLCHCRTVASTAARHTRGTLAFAQPLPFRTPRIAPLAASLSSLARCFSILHFLPRALAAFIATRCIAALSLSKPPPRTHIPSLVCAAVCCHH